MDDMNNKIDRITEQLASIDKTLALNTAHLDEHMRRTAKIEEELGPVVKHVNKMQGAMGLLIVLSLIATVIAGFAIFK